MTRPPEQLGYLPAEVLGACLAYLSPRDIGAASVASKSLYRHAESDILWRAMAPQLGLRDDIALAMTAEEIKWQSSTAWRSANRGAYDALQIMARTAGFNRRFYSCCDVLSLGNAGDGASTSALVAAGLSSGELHVFQVNADPSATLVPLRLKARPITKISRLHEGFINTVCLEAKTAVDAGSESGMVVCLTGGEDGKMFLLSNVSSEGPSFPPLSRFEIQRPLDQLGNHAGVVSSTSRSDFASCPTFAVGDEFGRVELIDVGSQRVVSRANVHLKTCSALRFAPSASCLGASVLASGGFDGRLVLSDARVASSLALTQTLLSPSLPHVEQRSCYRVYDLDFTAENILAAGCGDGAVRVFDLRQPGRILQILRPGDKEQERKSAHNADLHEVRSSLSGQRNDALSPSGLPHTGRGRWIRSLAFVGGSDATWAPCLLTGGGDHRILTFNCLGAMRTARIPLELLPLAFPPLPMMRARRPSALLVRAGIARRGTPSPAVSRSSSSASLGFASSSPAPSPQSGIGARAGAGALSPSPSAAALASGSPGSLFHSLLSRIASRTSVAAMTSAGLSSSSGASIGSAPSSPSSPLFNPESESDGATFDFGDLPPPAAAAPPSPLVGPFASNRVVSSGAATRKRGSGASALPLLPPVALSPPPLPIIACRPTGTLDVHAGAVVCLRCDGPWAVSASADESLVIRRLDQREDATATGGRGVEMRRHQVMPFEPEEEEEAGAGQLGKREESQSTIAQATSSEKPRPRLAGGSRALIIPPSRLAPASWDQAGSMTAHLRHLLGQDRK